MTGSPKGYSAKSMTARICEMLESEDSSKNKTIKMWDEGEARKRRPVRIPVLTDEEKCDIIARMDKGCADDDFFQRRK